MLEPRVGLVDSLCDRTKLDHNTATAFLTECDWDMAAALKKWELEGHDEGITSTPSTSHSSAASEKEWKPSSCGRAGSGDGASRLELPGYTFALPDMDRLSQPFRAFLEKDLIETSTLRRLENSRHLNWWVPMGLGQKLWPLSTTGDGNCLLHAASLGMWGVHDRHLMLRNALYDMLRKGSRRQALWRRWKWAEHYDIERAGLELSDEEWSAEWAAVVGLAAPTPRKSDDSSCSSSEQVYESLESIHVFALAHVLKRPIVVVSDTVLRNAKGEELSPVPFGGVYLPFECPPEQCHRSPLVLCYDSAHFSPLVPMRHVSNLQQVIPLTDSARRLLPVHFAVDPGPDFTWWRDEEDSRMAARLRGVSDADRLGSIGEYMELLRLETRRGSLRRTTPISTDTAATSAACKGMTLASAGGVSSLCELNARQEKRRLLNEIKQHLKRTLRISHSKGDKTIDVTSMAAELSSGNSIVAARLSACRLEYMDQMVSNYLKGARNRFDQANKAVGVPRQRISRSFSASSVLQTCINTDCQQPACESSNLLCSECLERQKELMTSFCCAHPGALRQLPAAKSTTMPAISQQFTAGHRRNDSTGTTASLGRRRPVLGVTLQGHSSTTSISVVEGDNGVTHYFCGSPPASTSPMVTPPEASPTE